jgi:hypothetical protein
MFDLDLDQHCGHCVTFINELDKAIFQSPYILQDSHLAIHHYLHPLPILFSRYSYEVMKEIEGLGVGSPFDQASNCVGDVSEAPVDLQSAASGCRNDGDVPVPIGKERMGMWRCRSRRVGVSVRRVARGLIN